MKRQRYKIISAEDFIRAYMKHDTTQEIAEALDTSQNCVSARACYLRKKGVKLPHKVYKVNYTKDFIDELNQVVESIQSEISKLSQPTEGGDRE